MKEIGGGGDKGFFGLYILSRNSDLWATGSGGKSFVGAISIHEDSSVFNSTESLCSSFGKTLVSSSDGLTCGPDLLAAGSILFWDFISSCISLWF